MEMERKKPRLCPQSITINGLQEGNSERDLYGVVRLSLPYRTLSNLSNESDATLDRAILS